MNPAMKLELTIKSQWRWLTDRERSACLASGIAARRQQE